MQITALITCFNRQDRVGDAIRSALAQTCPPAEILVIDDGSTDDSPRVLASFGSQIRVIRTENRGFPRALNLGVSEAQGDWIALLDSDDVWKPRKLQKQIAAAREFPDASLVFCDIEAVKHGTTIIESRFALGGVYGAEASCRDGLMRFDRSLFINMIDQSRIFTSSVLVKRTLPELKFPEEFRCCIDWPVWMNLVLHYPFAAVDEVLVRMHYDGDNLTARVGRILRNNAIVLNNLRVDPRLTIQERAAVEHAYEARRLGAMYHSLIEGDGAESRRLLQQIPREDVSRTRHLVYWIASWMPGATLRQLARWRSKAGAK
ncbi:MAG: glycosyltransferase family 2 protein [Planctomycetes bacterium]|nr:glycosyltransferase family 2 protein [Planctomycetota bacterium]